MLLDADDVVAMFHSCLSIAMPSIFYMREIFFLPFGLVWLFFSFFLFFSLRCSYLSRQYHREIAASQLRVVKMLLFMPLFRLFVFVGLYNILVYLYICV